MGIQPAGSAGNGSPPPTRKQLQGPRPPQLRVRKDSHTISKKPPVAPPLPQRPPQPVIIYSVSPKVIHTTVSDFMSLVQRLTGSSSAASGAGDVSPAARLASIERTSPKERDIIASANDDFMMGMGEGVQMGQIPGILSPAPASLPPISPELFASSGSDPYALSLLQDLSPYLHGNMFFPSPTLFSAPMVSTSPSSFDLLNPFFDF